jgi:nucleoside-diphosphate-sugar epimerase
MKVLVTGSKGFVGKKLVTELRNQNYSVKEFDITNGKDILNSKHLKDALEGTDIVFHLAAVIENENKKLWDINVEGTKKIIKESKKAGIKKFVFLSSTAVYGFTKKLVNEKSELNPKTIYEKSKAEGEKIVLEAQEDIGVVIVRSAMIFGANEYWKTMIGFLKKGFPLPLMGKNIFQIIYVNELVKILIHIMKKGKSGEVYLVAGKERWTLKEFTKKIKKKLGKKETILCLPSFISLSLGKILGIKLMTMENLRHLGKNRKYDLEKLEKLGYKQEISLENAIRKTIEEIKK